MIYRLEEKGAVRRVKKIGNAHVYQAVLTRKAVHRRLIGDLLNLFGGSAAPVMSHLIETGKLTLADIKELEKAVTAMEKKKCPHCCSVISSTQHYLGFCLLPWRTAYKKEPPPGMPHG